jgi:hypothetical protein
MENINCYFVFQTYTTSELESKLFGLEYKLSTKG